MPETDYSNDPLGAIVAKNFPYSPSTLELQQAIAEVPQFMGDSEEAYTSARCICSAGRALLVDYHGVWAHPQFIADAESLRGLVAMSLDSLEMISREADISAHAGHMADMIQNCRDRLTIFEVMASSKPLVTRKVEVNRLYDAMGAKNRQIELVR